jgi:hypothetical protein
MGGGGDEYEEANKMASSCSIAGRTVAKGSIGE